MIFQYAIKGPEYVFLFVFPLLHAVISGNSYVPAVKCFRNGVVRPDVAEGVTGYGTNITLMLLLALTFVKV